MLFHSDGSLQHAGVVLGIGGVAAHAFAHAPHDFAGEYRTLCGLSAIWRSLRHVWP
ncbi:hypothetical protein [Xanthomonas graminis]|uniref:hypothetical protein n=1 Tax=Xanthomonas graminis TaxID=3390026 RepID=UPI000AF12BA9|nr:hypothetical protein [Xanthomonas translucens]UKE77137.1 hypothetical protein KM317_17210 [Xanthomonas translucens pv. arrhenatheri]